MYARLTAHEETKVVATLRRWGRTDERDLVVFLVDTGARLSEALRLRWRDVSGPWVTFWDTKNGAARTVPLTSRLATILKTRRATSPASPFPLTYRRIHRAWRQVRRHLGLSADRDFVIHALRHTCASRLAQGGADLGLIKEWLGHKTLAMTLRYAHLSAMNLVPLARLLEARGRQLRSPTSGEEGRRTSRKPNPGTTGRPITAQLVINVFLAAPAVHVDTHRRWSQPR